ATPGRASQSGPPAPAEPGTWVSGTAARSRKAVPEGAVAVAAEVSAARRSTQERPGDDHALNLVRALVDLRDLGVSHHPLHRVVRDVAVSAQQLYAISGDPHRHVGRKELGHGGDLGQ